MVMSSAQMNSMSFEKLMELRGSFSAAKTAQQNGVVKRKNEAVQEAARTMLNGAQIPDGY